MTADELDALIEELVALIPTMRAVGIVGGYVPREGDAVLYFRRWE